MAVLRELRGMTQKALGARVGVSGVMISYIENGQQRPTAELGIELAETLEVDLQVLQFWTWTRPEPRSRPRRLSDEELRAELARQLHDEDNPAHPLKAERLRQGLTVAELAARARLKPSTVADIEAWRSTPSKATFRKLADALGLDPRVINPAFDGEFLSEKELQRRLAELGFSKQNPPHPLLLERLRRDLSRVELAELAGVSHPLITAIEEHGRIPNEKKVRAIATLLKMRPEELGLVAGVPRTTALVGLTGAAPLAAQETDRPTPRLRRPAGASATAPVGKEPAGFTFLTDSEVHAVLASLHHNETNPAHSLRVERVRRGLTPRQLGDLAHTSGSAIIRLEGGYPDFSEDLAARIAGALGLTVEDIGLVKSPAALQQARALAWAATSPEGLRRALAASGYRPDNPPHPVTVACMRKGWSTWRLARTSDVPHAQIQLIAQWDWNPPAQLIGRLATALRLDPHAQPDEPGGDGLPCGLWPIGHEEGLPLELCRILEGLRLAPSWPTDQAVAARRPTQASGRVRRKDPFEGRIQRLAEALDLSPEAVLSVIPDQVLDAGMLPDDPGTAATEPDLPAPGDADDVHPLTRRREAQGLNVPQLAELSGVDEIFLGGVEAGEFLPELHEVLPVAASLRAAPLEILAVPERRFTPEDLAALQSTGHMPGHWYADSEVITDIPPLPYDRGRPSRPPRLGRTLDEVVRSSRPMAYLVVTCLAADRGRRVGAALAAKVPLPPVRPGSPLFRSRTSGHLRPEDADLRRGDEVLRRAVVDPATAAVWDVDRVIERAWALGRRRGRGKGWEDTLVERARAEVGSSRPHPESGWPRPAAPEFDPRVPWSEWLAALEASARTDGDVPAVFHYQDADLSVDIPAPPRWTTRRPTSPRWTPELSSAALRTPQAAYLTASMVGFAAGYEDGRRKGLGRHAPGPSPVRRPAVTTAGERHGHAPAPVLLDAPPEAELLDRADAMLRSFVFGTVAEMNRPRDLRTTSQILRASQDLARRRGLVTGWYAARIHEAKVVVLGPERAGGLEMSVAGPVF